MTPRLDGMGVVLTRPRAAAEAMRAALEAEGARVFVFPALAIEPIAASATLAALLARLPTFDMAIFVSANAVEHGLEMARRAGPWPAHLTVAAIGEATSEALRACGVDRVLSPPERHDSEGLLALAQLQAVRERNVIVFRGEGGRERIKETLEERGAHVEYAECYRRVRPQSDPRGLLSAWNRGEVQAVSALSAETLRNFVAMMGSDATPAIAATTLVVPHPAIAADTDARGFARVAVASHGAAGLIEALSRIRVTT